MGRSGSRPCGIAADWPSTERLAADVLRTAADAIVVLDAGGRIAGWNDAACRLFGWSAEDVLGRPVTVLMPADRGCELERVSRTLSGEADPAVLKTVRLRKSGETVEVSSRLCPLTDAQGRVYGAAAIVREYQQDRLAGSGETSDYAEEVGSAASPHLARLTADQQARILVVDPATCRLGGWSSEADLIGRSLLEVLAPQDRQAAAQSLAAAVSSQTSQVEPITRILHASGRLVAAQVVISAIRDRDGDVLGWEAVFADVDAEWAMLPTLDDREHEWRLLTVHSADVALLCDLDGTVRFVSAAVGRQFGYKPEGLIGADGFSFFHADDEPHARARWAQAAASPGHPVTFEARVRDVEGRWRWVEQVVTSRLDVPEIRAMVVNLVDIDRRRRAENALIEIARRDPLTGAATRELLLIGLDATLANAATARHSAVAVLDLDRFKLINTAHGHEVGDRVLVATAMRLREATFDGELVARLGGDRFAVILHDTESPAALKARLQELLAALSGRPIVQAPAMSVTASAGAAYGPAANAIELLQSAEAALHEAKADVHNPLRVAAGAATPTAITEAVLLEDLKRGLLADEMVVHYQPILSLTTGAISGVEALVRWQHPERGLLLPGVFIDTAEDSGLIIDIGQKVLLEACAAAARWAHLGSDDLPFHIAINLSAKQLVTAAAVELVEKSLAAAGAHPRNLMLEVTESAVMADVEAVSATLQQLRDLGLAIAIDDFGTGYSSLTYLKRFPVTALKIDRSFINGLGSDEDDAAIVASVISLARAVHLDCIAEGIETDQQRGALQHLGCGYGQGFLWSPARTADDFDQWARQHQPASVMAHGGKPSTKKRAVDRRGRNPATPPGLLARIAALQAEGASLHTIAAALNAENILTDTGKRWHPRSVAQVVANHSGLLSAPGQTPRQTT